MKRRLLTISITILAICLIGILSVACDNKGNTGEDNSQKLPTVPVMEAVNVLPRENKFNGDTEHYVCLEVANNLVEHFDLELCFINPDGYSFASVTINEREIKASDFSLLSGPYKIIIEDLSPDIKEGIYTLNIESVRYLKGSDDRPANLNDLGVVNINVNPEFTLTLDRSAANLPEDAEKVTSKAVKYCGSMGLPSAAEMNGTSEGQVGYEDYIFDGWYTAPEGGEKVAYYTSYLFYSDVTLYARYDRAVTYSVGEDYVTITGLTEAGKATGFPILIPATLEGKPVTTIGSYAFAGIGANKSFVLADSVTTIEDSAFRNSVNMVIDLANVVTIGESAFQDCREIYLGSGERYSNTRVANLPSTLEEIGNYAFYHSGFDVHFPNPAANSYITAKKTLFIPQSVKKIGKGAFKESLFEKVYFATDNALPAEAPEYDSKNKCYNYSGYALGEGIFEGSSELNTVFTGVTFTPYMNDPIEKADNGLKVITDKMFYNCHNLKSFNAAQDSGVFLGEGLVFIGVQAFNSTTAANSSAYAGMPDYKVQEFPASLRVIESYAFANTAIYSVTFKENSELEKLGDWCFMETLISEITLYSLADYGMDPFWGNTRIRTINILSNSVPTFHAATTSTLTRYARFYVRPELLSAFRNDSSWASGSGNSLGMSAGNLICAYGYETDSYHYEPINEAGNYDPASTDVRITFIKTRNQTADIPAEFTVTDGETETTYTVRRIGCYSLLPEVREIKLPHTVTEIEDYAFYVLPLLSKVTWKDSGNNALTDNAINDIMLKRIGQYAFYGTSITKFYSNSSLEEIGKEAFEMCVSLKTVVLNEGNGIIVRGSAFSNSKISLLVISKNVAVIEGAAFKSQSDPITIYFEATTPPYAYYDRYGNGQYSSIFPFGDCPKIQAVYLFGDEAMSAFNSTITYKTLKKEGGIESAYVKYNGTWASMLSALAI